MKSPTTLDDEGNSSETKRPYDDKLVDLLVKFFIALEFSIHKNFVNRHLHLPPMRKFRPQFHKSEIFDKKTNCECLLKSHVDDDL